jgi:starch-binding outer membrane protein, SusD/RagB family
MEKGARNQKNKICITIFLLCLFLTSCQDWLELIPPDGLVLNEYWKSKEDVEAVLMGAYQKFAQMDERLFLYGELRADMIAEDVNTPSPERMIMQGNIYPDNSLCNWSDFYIVINYCNEVLKHAPEVFKLDASFSEYQLKGFEAEAFYLRSLSYFYLVRIFKDVPLILEPSESDDVEFFQPASTDTSILRVIKDDLKKARFVVTEYYGSQEENIGRATKGAILALLADICLWNFEYDECISYINELENLDYLLLPAGKWFEIFYPGNSMEGIFEFQLDNKLDQPNSLYDYTYYSRFYKASPNALDRLSPEESFESIRGAGSLRTYDAKIWKYCGGAPDGKTLRPSADIRSCNWIVYRYADILLMKAEALSQLGRYDEALQIININIRNRALMNSINITNSPEAFEDAILDERAKELAFEGKRWFDLLRMGRRNNYSRKEKLIEIIIEKVPSTQKLVLASKLTDPLGWYLPIEEDELERNNNLEQNPYYAEYSND